jgi:hypothetical protein
MASLEDNILVDLDVIGVRPQEPMNVEVAILQIDRMHIPLAVASPV